MKGANVLVTNDGQVKIAGETGTMDPLRWITDGSLAPSSQYILLIPLFPFFPVRSRCL